VNPIRKQFQYGDRLVTLETGEIARQANGAVMIDVEGTTLLVTVVAKKRSQRRRLFSFDGGLSRKSLRRW